MRILTAIVIVVAPALWAGTASASPPSGWGYFERTQVRERQERREMMQRPQQRPGFIAPQPRNVPPPVQQQRYQQPAPQPRNFNPPQQMPEAPRISPGDAARRAQQQYGGRVLSVSPSGDGYRVKMLKDGEVSIVSVPN